MKLELPLFERADVASEYLDEGWPRRETNVQDALEMEQVVSSVEDKIRQRAYELWEQHGTADGSERDFWLQAELEIANEKLPEPPQDRLE